MSGITGVVKCTKAEQGNFAHVVAAEFEVLRAPKQSGVGLAYTLIRTADRTHIIAPEDGAVTVIPGDVTKPSITSNAGLTSDQVVKAAKGLLACNGQFVDSTQVGVVAGLFNGLSKGVFVQTSPH